MSAVTNSGGASNASRPVSERLEVDEPALVLALDTRRTAASVKISAPWLRASGR